MGDKPVFGGITLTTSHPGGGKSRLELTKDEARRLGEELMEKQAGEKVIARHGREAGVT